jgi:hypothetical protein
MNEAYAIDWLREFGGVLRKGRWKDIRELEDGRAEATLECPRLGDCLAIVRDTEALKAMAEKDAEAKHADI